MELQLTSARFLTSPIVEIEVGEGDDKTTLTAHQTLLRESPFLEELVNQFEDSGPRRIELPAENVQAFGCFLQFQYTRDYTLPSETNGSTEVATADSSGEELLQHARVYTLAEKLELPILKTLAHKKIHRVNSTPGGELAYARYVYTHTLPDDMTIRKPIAAYWADQGHVLRHDLKEEFKQLCLDLPEFAYDVLTLLFDKQEKGAKKTNPEIESVMRGSGRKRRRDI
ncbi:hypothetical protein N7468_005727 [Penicillium chermesinum]|uniref:BTB domain-containing protein n=1 Tax=Penicillium chermesinum TaxID=63820 RepID=A0A9W9NZR6_9EURO|nr:uncharacterized protein N7468_005727 [Penicillium chermesinum]KAJ5232771.1 hypothetical protein N7468_005727 [Penicillium chermesinum]KAJ6172430.1 hypothetical protein N7470_001497 [Penicillium chermesinum]